MNSANIKRLRKASKVYSQKDNGSVTIEFLMWLPLFALFIAIMVNASFLMHVKTSMLGIARDASRLVATEGYTATEAEATMDTLLASSTYDYVVTVEEVDISTSVGSASFAKATVTLPFSDVVILGNILDNAGAVMTTVSNHLIQTVEEDVDDDDDDVDS